MSIETLAQTVLVDGVTKVSVSEIQQDEESGLYIRELRIFGAGTPTPQVFVLRLGAALRASIAINTPESTF